MTDFHGICKQPYLHPPLREELHLLRRSLKYWAVKISYACSLCLLQLPSSNEHPFIRSLTHDACECFCFSPALTHFLYIYNNWFDFNSMHAALLWFRVAIEFIWMLNQMQNFTLSLRIEQLSLLFLLYGVYFGVCVCCLTLLHVLSGPTEPPHPTSPITQSPPSLFHKGTSALPVSPSTTPNIYTYSLPCKKKKKAPSQQFKILVLWMAWIGTLTSLLK